MWMRFPAGAERISVQQQNFEVEYKDSEGNCYTRVPNPFVTALIRVGFHSVERPEGAPEDLPPSDPLRDGAIADLSKDNEALRKDIQNYRTDLRAAQAQINALEEENKGLKSELEKTKAQIVELTPEE